MSFQSWLKKFGTNADAIAKNKNLRNMQKEVMKEFFKKSEATKNPVSLFALVFMGAGKTNLKMLMTSCIFDSNNLRPSF